MKIKRAPGGGLTNCAGPNSFNIPVTVQLIVINGVLGQPLVDNGIINYMRRFAYYSYIVVDTLMHHV